MKANVMSLWTATWLIAAVGGFACPGASSECEDLFVAFDFPKDMMTGVGSTTDVSVTVSDGTGAAVQLDAAQLVTRASAATEFSAPRDGTLSSTRASFSSVTLEPGGNVIKVTVRQKGTVCVGTRSITVEVPVVTQSPRVLTFKVPQDAAAPSSVLNGVELPNGSDLRIELTTQGAVGGTVEILNTATLMRLGSPTPVTSASVAVLLPSSALADGTYSLFAHVTKGGTSNTEAGNADAVAVITLDRTAPACVVGQPSANPLGRPADANQATTAFDFDEVVTTSLDVEAIVFRVSKGQTIDVTQTSVTGGMGTQRFTLTQTSGELLYDLGATCTDRAGNSTAAALKVDVLVDLEPPVCSVAAPTAAGSPYGSFDLTTSINVTGAGTVGLPVEILTTAATGPIASLVVSAGGVASGTVSYPHGAQGVTARGRDLAQNSCTTPPVAINVSAPGCAITFTSPRFVNGSAAITSAPFNVSGHSNNCGAGLSVTLFDVVAGIPTAIGTPQMTNATGDATFAVTLAEGGPYRLRLQINNGSGVLTDTDLSPVFVDVP